MPCGETWLTGDNKLVALHDMSPRHLENTISYLGNRSGDGYEVAEDDDLDMIEAMKQELERRQALREQHGAGVTPF